MSGARPKVLIVDDDPAVQEMLRAVLEFEGYAPVLAGDGLEALDALDALSAGAAPAVILLDLMLPRMDGYAFVAERRRRGLLPGVPLVVLTADGRAAQKAAQLGAEGYVQKPFELDTLLAEIERVARR